jgi:hypothetical protein
MDTAACAGCGCEPWRASSNRMAQRVATASSVPSTHLKELSIRPSRPTPLSSRRSISMKSATSASNLRSTPVPIRRGGGLRLELPLATALGSRLRCILRSFSRPRPPVGWLVAGGVLGSYLLRGAGAAGVLTAIVIVVVSPATLVSIVLFVVLTVGLGLLDLRRDAPQWFAWLRGRSPRSPG